MINDQSYSATLTSDAFLYYELKQVLKLKVQGLTDAQIRETVIDENIFQYKSKKSASRLLSSVMRRVRVLDDNLMNMFINEPIDVGKIINLYTIMKTSRLFFEFMNEVIKEKLEYRYEILDKKDINIFFTAKSEQSDIVAGWSDETIRKLKQVILKILSEVGIIQEIKTGKLDRKSVV